MNRAEAITHIFRNPGSIATYASGGRAWRVEGGVIQQGYRNIEIGSALKIGSYDRWTPDNYEKFHIFSPLMDSSNWFVIDSEVKASELPDDIARAVRRLEVCDDSKKGIANLVVAILDYIKAQ